MRSLKIIFPYLCKKLLPRNKKNFWNEVFSAYHEQLNSTRNDILTAYKNRDMVWKMMSFTTTIPSHHEILKTCTFSRLCVCV